MKFCSVTFFGGKSKIGGAQVPAYAFSEWMQILGSKCVVVEEPVILPDCDFVFLNTPPTYPIEIKVPFAMMIHDEGDLNAYEYFPYYANHPLCAMLIHIDHDGDFYKDFHYNRVAWHPCCMPGDLICKTGVYSPNPLPDMLYASRITPWKHGKEYKEFTEWAGFSGCMAGNISNTGYAESIGYEYKSIDDLNFYLYDVIWDVSSSKSGDSLVKRNNLTAFEALKKGLMPIVNSATVTDDLKGAFIEVDLPIDFKVLYDKITAYRINKLVDYKNAIEIVKKSHASYQSTEKTMKVIHEKATRQANKHKANSIKNS